MSTIPENLDNVGLRYMHLMDAIIKLTACYCKKNIKVLLKSIIDDEELCNDVKTLLVSIFNDKEVVSALKSVVSIAEQQPIA